MILIKRDRKRRISGQDQLGVALAPVPKVRAKNQWNTYPIEVRATHLITAMFTGAEAVA